MKKIYNIILIIFLLLIIFPLHAYAAETTIKDAECNFVFNDDGTLSIEEIWKINIVDYNTLFLSFSINDNVKNVNVSIIENNVERNLKKIDEVQYYVEKDSFYALPINDSSFEIAWGVGLENESEDRTYKITYTLDNYITKMDTYSEWNWDIISVSREFPIKKLHGTITVGDLIIVNFFEDGKLKIDSKTNNSIKFSAKNLKSDDFASLKMYLTDNNTIPNIPDNQLQSNSSTEIDYALITIYIAYFLGFLLGLFIYFLPTYIASKRKHSNKASIILVNILLGWTFIGWVVAIVWAVSSQNSNIIQNTNKYDDLEKLHKLKNEGIISEKEFEKEKNKLIK